MENKLEQQLLRFLIEPLIYHPSFFTFEGGEGSGKSTALKTVAQKLSDAGYEVLVTREPGGSDERAEAIRSLIYNPLMDGMDVYTELLLFAASRAEHVRKVIYPALNKGKIVLCDRYVDSSFVYQGYCHDVLETVIDVNLVAIAHLMPKTTFFFDIKPEQGLARIFAHRGAEVNYTDERPFAFHQKVYEGFQQLSGYFMERYTRIDACADKEQVAQDVYQRIIHQLEE